ncbi:[citrate (pro-3S)-lyase] ligase [Weissella sp. GP1]|uniref:[citrate (pro-3S)-lyase] ligase n=1 Tax=Weissella confusa TaxID=1583 RepID=UPI0032DA80B5
MTDELRDLYLSNTQQRRIWQRFVSERGIPNFNTNEIDVIEETIGLFNEEDELVGTGSITDHVIKYVAVCDKGADSKGARFNRIISELEGRLVRKGQSHYFVFTKPEYVISFGYVGFKVLATSEYGALLEKGTPTIQTFIKNIPKYDGTKAAIVMNANPFTLGHRYLVEQASKENDHVYIFVVNQDVSLFTTAERFNLVKQGVADLDNVDVINGQEYMVSYLSFPSYFIKNADDVIKYQTTLDARLFRDGIAKPLNITKRYVGTEPLSHTTAIYNETLQTELQPSVQLIEIDRKQFEMTHVISATTVRSAIERGEEMIYQQLVPPTTKRFIDKHLDLLQERIEGGKKVNGN